jgi:hypothetical protein
MHRPAEQDPDGQSLSVQQVFCGLELTKEQMWFTQLPEAQSLPLVQGPELFPFDGWY